MCRAHPLVSKAARVPPHSAVGADKRTMMMVTPQFLNRLRHAIVYALHRAWKWLQASRAGPALQCAWVVLLEYRVLWFAALDAGMLVVIAVLAVVGGLETSDSLCRSAAAVVLVLMALQLLLVAILRPYTTLFAVVHGTTTLMVTCFSIGAQLAFIVSSTNDSPKLWLVNASAGCDLVVVGFTALKMVLDTKGSF